LVLAGVDHAADPEGEDAHDGEEGFLGELCEVVAGEFGDVGVADGDDGCGAWGIAEDGHFADHFAAADFADDGGVCAVEVADGAEATALDDVEAVAAISLVEEDIAAAEEADGAGGLVEEG